MVTVCGGLEAVKLTGLPGARARVWASECLGKCLKHLLEQFIVF